MLVQSAADSLCGQAETKIHKDVYLKREEMRITARQDDDAAKQASLSSHGIERDLDVRHVIRASKDRRHTQQLNLLV